MSTELYAQWRERRAEVWSAVVYPLNPCPPLLLTTWLSPADGRWHACTEFEDRFGSWASPVAFSTPEAAQEWAERQAEAIIGTYPTPGGDLR